MNNNFKKHINYVLDELKYPLLDINIQIPKQISHGDLTTNIAMLLAKELKLNPIEIANNIIKILKKHYSEYYQNISTAGPGFINVKLNKNIILELLKEIKDKNENYGKNKSGKGKNAIVEFVSANPTGPLTVAHGRGAIVGDTVSRILEWNGFNVDREYYFNNAGRQMRILGESVKSRYLNNCGINNKFPEDNKYWQTGKFSGFHFDAVLFANWLRDNYAKPRGVKHIKRNLKKKPKADIVFDCTGFKSQFNDSPWVDVDYLPNNSAVVTRIGYQDIENQLKPTTDCTALNNGWVWNVPTWDRIGTGYVYCDKFCTDDEARDEFRKYLTDNVESDVNCYSDKMFRTIKWTTGRREESWKDNVISIGLSAGFIEPLESNGILAIHNNLLTFLRVMDDRENITQFMRDTYNNSCNQGFDEFASFIGIHFSLTQRNDTPYWQHISDMCYPKDGLIDRVQRNYTESSYKFGQLYDWADNSTEGVFYVMAGHGWNPFNDAVFSEMDFFDASVDQIEEVPFNLDNLKSPWEYYKETIYEN